MACSSAGCYGSGRETHDGSDGWKAAGKADGKRTFYFSAILKERAILNCRLHWRPPCPTTLRTIGSGQLLRSEAKVLSRSSSHSGRPNVREAKHAIQGHENQDERNTEKHTAHDCLCGVHGSADVFHAGGLSDGKAARRHAGPSSAVGCARATSPLFARE